MKNMVLLLLMSLNVFAVNVGEVPKELTLSGENGGHTHDDSAWNSSSIKNKIYVLFYMDPDKKDVNDNFFKTLDAKQFNSTLVGRIAIVNLAATWKPNYVIETLLSARQDLLPDTIFLKDKKSILVKEWGLADDASDVLIFSKKGEVLFYKAGELSTDEIKEAIELIETNLK
ncbi:YtfJ family protein [bacterium]|nr:YtfJ family protein [bacterium]MBU1956779.1 YtfJ family protein [bacterium]